jgi:hypothetical protein
MSLLLLGPRASRPPSLNATSSELPGLIEPRVNLLLEAGETPAVPVRAGQTGTLN